MVDHIFCLLVSEKYNVKMFSQKDYKISVYSDSLAYKNTYRTLIWLHIHDKFEFL